MITDRLAENNDSVGALVPDLETVKHGGAIAAKIEERRRVYRIFHDTVAPNLISAALILKALRKSLGPTATPDQLEKVQSIAESLNGAMQAMTMALTVDEIQSSST
jgi:signal transduction histidine kinase